MDLLLDLSGPLVGLRLVYLPTCLACSIPKARKNESVPLQCLQWAPASKHFSQMKDHNADRTAIAPRRASVLPYLEKKKHSS